MTSVPDDTLTAWREAYLAGGLPRPVRADRWQVLRAGVVNLWEFTENEYWYAGGWAQLTGRNESGKSSLMALTTLIPWLADVSTHNIDTLGTGRRGKQFRYYVEATGDDGDRRPTDASSSRGWLWVEYGRLDEDGAPVFFTGLGHFTARRGVKDFRRDWVSVEGAARVRSGVDLLVNRSVRTPGDLGDVVGLVRHDTAGDYRRHIAARLLSSDEDSLDAIGKMLRVARLPKLGQNLNERFVADHLRDALPGLEPSEVAKLAEGWDELDKVRRDVELTREAVDALRHYLNRTWRPYLRLELRHCADTASLARTRLDEVTARERAATEKLHQARQDQDRIDADAGRRRRQIDSDEQAATELLASSRYQDATQRVQQVANQKNALRRAREREDEVRSRAGQAADRLEQARETAARDQRTRDTRRQAQEAATAALTRLLTQVGVPDEAVAAGDWELLRRLLRERTERLARLRALFREFDKADQTALRQEELAAQQTDAAGQAHQEAEAAWDRAQQTRNELAVQLARWAGSLPDGWALPTPEVDQLVEQLPDSPDSGTARLVDRLRDGWFVPRDRRQADTERALREQGEALASRRRELEAERDHLRAVPDPTVPAPPALTRRERPAPGPDGAPLWRLLDAATGDGQATDERNLAAIEAGLTAAGLLDTWATPDGRYDTTRDGLDTLLRADLPPLTGPTLGDVLRAVDDPGPRRALVQRLLQGIAWGADAPWALWPDGRWQTPDRSGRAELDSGAAELIGETARQRARERRLAVIEAELAELIRQDTDVQRRHAELAAERAELQRLLGAVPNDDTLRTELVLAADRTRRAEEQDIAAQTARNRAQTLRIAADAARATAYEFAGTHQLPTPDDERDTLRTRLGQAENALATAQTAATQTAEAEETAARSTRQVVEAEQEQARESAAHEAATAARRSDEHTLDRLEATLDADTAEVLAEARRLDEAVDAGRQALEELRAQAGDLRETLGRAQADLANAEQARAGREAERDESYRRFRVLLDHGVHDELGLDLPDAQARTITATRSQVSAVREQIQPRDWPTEPGQRADLVLKARDRLGRLDDLRGRLGAGGRDVRLETTGPLPTLEVIVDVGETRATARDGMRQLERIHAELSRDYDTRMTRTLEELLGSAFINHLRTRLAAVDALVRRINDVLARHPTGTTRTVLRIDLQPTQGASQPVLAALRGSAMLVDPATQAQVRDFLRNRIESARAAGVAEGNVDWGEKLADALDYRTWWEVHLRMRAGEGARWGPVNANTFSRQSGGARVVILMLPLIATLIAMYESTPGAPRPFWLDEAFDGLDQTNRDMVLELLGEFDLDVLLVGPGRLLNSAAVAAGAIFQVVRAEYPHPGADLTCELWAGNELTPLEPQDPALGTDDPDTLFGVDL